MTRSLLGALLAFLASTSLCTAEMATYGNPSGCAALREDWDNVSDLMVLVTPDEAVRWEQSCPLTNPNHDGKEMQVTCSGVGEEWPLVITLFVDQARPEVMVYSEVDPTTKGASVMLVELSRCE